jgi:ribulose-5-phosphate 4-epimerase/fuculose-1-phosphate aldolase
VYLSIFMIFLYLIRHSLTHSLTLSLSHTHKKKRPDVKAIVHVHTEAGQYVSCLPGDSPLVFYTQDGGGFYGKVGIHDFEGVATENEECERIERDVTTKTHTGELPDTLIMRSHGTTTMGTSIGAAFVKNFYLDRVCRIQMNLEQGNSKADPLSDVMLRRMALQYKREDIMHGCEWPAMVEYAEKYLECDLFE